MKEQITIDDVAKLDLRIATVISAEFHPKADKLLVLQVDVGEEKPRQIVAGIRPALGAMGTAEDPSILNGKQILVVVNLPPAVLRGVESNGMLFAASAGFPVLIGPQLPVQAGAEVR